MAIEPARDNLGLPVITGAVSNYLHILEAVSGLGIPVSYDGEGADEGIALEILSSGELYRTEGEKDTLSSDDAIGRRFAFRAASVHATTGDPERWGFASYEVTDTESGEQLILNSSSITILARFAAAIKAGKLPYEAEVWKAEKPTRRGFYPIDLVEPGTRKPAGKRRGKPTPAGGATEAEADGNGEDF